MKIEGKEESKSESSRLTATAAATPAAKKRQNGQKIDTRQTHTERVNESEAAVRS